MSRADWSFLEHLLEEGQEHSTGVGRVWLTVLFLFRILVLGTAAESAWDDEQSDFVCNTKQPGCEAVCYDQAFPVSHFRYFVLQVIFVSTPTIFYFGYVALRAAKEAKQKEEVGEKEGRKPQRGRDGAIQGLEVIKESDEKDACYGVNNLVGQENIPEIPRMKGRLLCAYTLSIFLKVALEIGFILGLWVLYGFTVPAKYECERSPCPHVVDCFVSRPTEKTIFTIYTQAIAIISIFLNIIELLSVLQIFITNRLEKRYLLQKHKEISKEAFMLEPGTESPVSLSYQEKTHLFLPLVEGSLAQSAQNYPILDPGANWKEQEELPSYVHCMSSTRSQSSKHKHHSKHSKSHRKADRHDRHKQYV
ncbi:gap junction alpha-4 protein [Denticeps clupeoides]|uniref:Gap junction protein n=1 Tax=Denticeps clupeoides TaxID=299321 RepID=A0AAY4DRR9_9TELE|nr:gap junction alpha-4 protein-like [Denticeps clupeoides]